MINGRMFYSSTVAEKDENGDWKVIAKLVEKLRKDGDEDWRTEEISAMCTHAVFQTAYNVAMNSVLEQFNEKVKESNGAGMFKPADYEESGTESE